MRLVATLKDDGDRDMHHWDLEVDNLTAEGATSAIERAMYALVETLRIEARRVVHNAGEVTHDRLRYLSERHFV